MSDYPQSYDVIVIGAGSVGTSAALSLAQAGLKVLVLDAMPSAGQGSNKHAIGGIRATHSDPAKIRLCLRSIEIFSTWKEVYGDDIEWYKGGYVFVAYREQEEQTLKTLLQKQQAYGLNISWLDSGDLRKLIPHLNPEGLIGGTYSPNDGSASPLLSIHAFYKQARNYGAEFHFNEPVTEIIVRSGKIQGVKTSKGMYSTPVVIHASGAWAKSLMNPIGIEIPVQPDSHEAAITEPVQRMFDPMIVDIRPAQGSANFYFYQHKTGQILFCITPSPNIWGFDIWETSAFLPMVSKRMVEVMPSLRHIRIRRTWRGLYPMTPDGFPIVGWSREAEGLLLAVGMCGQGYMLGPGLGELLTRMVTNTLSPGDEEILSILSPYREFVGQEKLK